MNEVGRKIMKVRCEEFLAYVRERSTGIFLSGKNIRNKSLIMWCK
jgi:hypothetical protein